MSEVKQAVVQRASDEAAAPVARLAHDVQDREGPAAGIGLCLSGGGYRAMLFHLGALWRLNELGYLPKLGRISSVSGGSITAARLGLVWGKLDFDPAGVARAFEQEVAAPIRALAGHTVDVPSVTLGAALPFVTAADLVERAYKKHLFGDARLADLPVEGAGRPTFILNAANVQTGALFRFQQKRVADWRIGINTKAPSQIPLARAVAASAAFAPFLSPVIVELDPDDFEATEGADLHVAPYTKRIVLTDGGNYDNLGLETAYKRLQTILVSDAGASLRAEPEPGEDWIRHGKRAVELLLDEIVSVRKRQLIAAYQQQQRAGAYWSVRSAIADYQLGDAWPFDPAVAQRLAATPTRLEALDDEVQRGLVDWGYAICDTAIRKHVDPRAPRPTKLPSGG